MSLSFLWISLFVALLRICSHSEIYQHCLHRTYKQTEIKSHQSLLGIFPVLKDDIVRSLRAAVTKQRHRLLLVKWIGTICSYMNEEEHPQVTSGVSVAGKTSGWDEGEVG